MKLAARRFVRGLAAPLLLLAAACSDAGVPTGALVAPDERPLFQQSSSGPDYSQLARFNKTPHITIAWAKKWIGPEGGRLDFQGFAIDVPPGAVDKVTQFSIRLPVDPDGADHVVAEFGPHGAVFAKAVAIEVPLHGTTAETLEAPAIGWWNEGAARWDNLGGSVTADGKRLRVGTGHFSTYGSLYSDGILLSGG